ncbi:MAG: hypothetical protein C5B58_06350 [Acidobacteria bacterium]|nr:MAG: hypothetical protein C5B58_06350 [Acidobacteriota bacterium]
MTHFALLTYSTTNIGDDIQSLAAEQFLPGVDVRVDRDHLAATPDGAPDKTKIILNGWHTHAPEQWPPASFLSPLLVSVHITNEVYRDNRAGLPPSAFLTRGIALRYFSQHAPVGARDLWTRDLFLKSDVPSEFTGCLTLTLGAREKYVRQDYVCAVDLPRPALNHLRCSSSRQVVASSHQIGSDASWGDRMWFARRLLSVYACAHCVVTTRLHCALPCLALGTPVLLLRTAPDDYRFTGLDSLFRNCTLDEFLRGNIEFNVEAPPSNSDAYLPLRRDLIARASSFVGLANKDADVPPFPFEASQASATFLQIISDRSASQHSVQGPQVGNGTISIAHVRAIFPPGRDYSKLHRPEFLRDISRLLAATGDQADALRLMRSAHEERPNGMWIAELLKRYEENIGDVADVSSGSPAPVIIRPSTLASSVVEKHLTYLSAERLESLIAQLERVKFCGVPGDFLEFGVALGGSGICIASQLEGTRKYWGFDSFRLMPPPTENDGDAAKRRYETIASGHSSGLGKNTYYGYIDKLYDHVMANFVDYGLRVDGRSINLIDGEFGKTLPAYSMLTIAAAHVDCSWYDAVIYCLRYIYPRLSRFGAIIVDDYCDWSGCREAVDEFCTEARDIILLKTNPHAVLVRA